MLCRNEDCGRKAIPGRLRCAEHDHRARGQADPGVTLGRDRPQLDHPDGCPTFDLPVKLPDGLRRKVLEVETLSDAEKEIVLSLIDTGLSAVNLIRAERDYGRRELLLRSVRAFRTERSLATRSEDLIERARRALK